MNYEFRVDPRHNAFVCTVSGEVTLDGVKQSIIDRYEHPDYRPGSILVIDLSDTPADALVDFDLDEYQRFTREIRAKHDDRNPSFMVAPTDLSFGLSRMSQQIFQARDGQEVSVCRTLDEAFERIAALASSSNSDA